MLFDVAGGALTAADVQLVDKDLPDTRDWAQPLDSGSSTGRTRQGIHFNAPTGGTPPYTNTIHISTSSGFTPGGGNLASTVSDIFLDGMYVLDGLTPATTYYVKVKTV